MVQVRVFTATQSPILDEVGTELEEVYGHRRRSTSKIDARLLKVLSITGLKTEQRMLEMLIICLNS